jgi:hypothetical protein
MLCDSGELPPDDMISALRAYLLNHVMGAVIAEEYDEAAYWKGLAKKLTSDEVEEKRQKEEQMVKLRTIEERMEVARQTLAEVTANWENKLAEFETEKRVKFGEMQTRHEQEIADFRQHWSEPTTLMAFTKPSTQLILIRKQQRLSALTDDFARAKELKRRGDDLEKHETAAAERKASASMKALHANLLRKHAQESQHTQMNWERQLTNLMTERDAEIEKVELRIRQLEMKQCEMRGGKSRITLTMSRMTAGSSRASSRAKRIHEFKNGALQERLPLTGVAAPRSKPARSREGKRTKVSIGEAEF